MRDKEPVTLSVTCKQVSQGLADGVGLVAPRFREATVEPRSHIPPVAVVEAVRINEPYRVISNEPIEVRARDQFAGKLPSPRRSVSAV